MFYSFINWYTERFPFPQKGLKYFLRFLSITGNRKRIFRKKLSHGLFIFVSPAEHIQCQIFWYGFYEKKYALTWQSFIAKDAIIVDIGANIGYYTLMAAKAASEGKIYAFEPSSKTFHLLARNLLFNQLTNAVAIPMAISEEGGTKNLYVSKQENSGLTGLMKTDKYDESIEEITATTLDEWYEKEGLKKIDLIKIDIEGADFLALKGMSKILQTCQPVLFVEISKPLLYRYKNTTEEVYDYLLNFGYKAYCIIAENTLQYAFNGQQDELILFIPEGKKIPAAVMLIP